MNAYGKIRWFMCGVSAISALGCAAGGSYGFAIVGGLSALALAYEPVSS